MALEVCYNYSIALIVSPAVQETRIESRGAALPRARQFRGYPRGFITWDDSIGIHPQNPRCYCGLPSRQDWKGEKACVKPFGEGFWVCASGACDYFSDREGWSSL